MFYIQKHEIFLNIPPLDIVKIEITGITVKRNKRCCRAQAE